MPPKKFRPFTPQYFKAATEAAAGDGRLPKSVARTLEAAHRLIKRAFEIESQCAAPEVGLVRPQAPSQSSPFATKYNGSGRMSAFGGGLSGPDDFIIREPQNARAFKIQPHHREMDSQTESLLGLVTMLQNCRSHAAGLWATARS